MAKKTKRYTIKEKQIWNDAIRKATKEVMKYDGIIVNDREREYMKDMIEHKLLYKLNRPKL